MQRTDLLKTINQVEKAWIDGGEFRNAKGTSDLSEIISKNIFKNPKPIALVEWCINLVPKKDNQIILDFFGGSGTTGHAVLDLNRSEKKEGNLLEDSQEEGNRTFILCQLNEKTETTPNGFSGSATLGSISCSFITFSVCCRRIFSIFTVTKEP